MRARDYGVLCLYHCEHRPSAVNEFRLLEPLQVPGNLTQPQRIEAEVSAEFGSLEFIFHGRKWGYPEKGHHFGYPGAEPSR